jgi:hypothetical protein
MGFYIPWLVDAARTAVAGTGRKVIVSPGWQTRGHGPMRLVEVVAGHHTGTRNSAPGDYPSLPVVRDGRAGLAGPLSQYGLGRSGDVYVIAAGRCYHAGASAFAGFTDLNDEAVGIEAESAGDGRWSDGQILIYPRLVGSCLFYLRRGTGRYASHRTIARPPGRKPDPTGISDEWMRQRAAAFLAGEDDVVTPDDIEKIAQRTKELILTDNFLTGAFWRIDAIRKGAYTVEGGPTKGEQVGSAELAAGTAWRLLSTLQLQDTVAGGPQRVIGEEIPLVELLKRIDRSVQELLPEQPAPGGSTSV